VLHNWLFITISTLIIVVQVVIIFIGGETFSVTRLTGDQWAISVVLGFLCIPFGFLVGRIPDEVFVGWFQVVERPSKAVMSRFKRRASVASLEV
jgi:Ca2+-transporting ATPase